MLTTEPFPYIHVLKFVHVTYRTPTFHGRNHVIYYNSPTLFVSLLFPNWMSWALSNDMQALGVGFQVPKGWGHLGLGPGPHFQASSDLRWVPESRSDKGHSRPASTEDSWLPWVTQPPDLWLPPWVSPSPPQPRGNTTSSPGLGWIRDSSLQVSLKSCSGKRGAGSFLSEHRMASAMSFPIEEDICPASCGFTLGHSEGQKTWWFTQDRWPCQGPDFPCGKDTLVSSVLLQRSGLGSSRRSSAIS